MEVSLFLAFLAGLLSFVTPCVLALVPVYLAFLGASVVEPTTADGAAAPAARPPLAPALLFVAGFSLLFIVLGTSVGLLGAALFRTNEARIVAGAIVIGIGLLSTGLFGPALDRFRLSVPTDLLPASRNLRALGLGALVAVGWSPCIGPVLGAILTMGASTRDAGAAALLLAAYAAGLAVPFVAAALALPRIRPVLGWLRRHHRSVQAISGAFIVLIGILIVTNAFTVLANLFTFFI